MPLTMTMLERISQSQHVESPASCSGSTPSLTRVISLLKTSFLAFIYSFLCIHFLPTDILLFIL